MILPMPQKATAPKASHYDLYLPRQKDWLLGSLDIQEGASPRPSWQGLLGEGRRMTMSGGGGYLASYCLL